MSQNEIPNGWENLDLSRLPYDKGKSSQKYKDGNLVYLTPEYLRDGSNPTMIATFPKCVFSNVDDTILLWDGSNSGEVFKAKKGILSSTMVKFVVNGICDAQFFYYSLKSQEEKIRAETRGSGIPHVDKSTLSKLKCIKPKSLSEQQKIAKILLTVDQAIDKTKDLIEKHERIKQGLVLDLFEPKKGWKRTTLGELGDFKNGINKAKEDFGFGTMFVNIIDAYPERLATPRLERLNADYRERRTYGLNVGDIIFVRSSVKPEGVGYTTLFEGYKESVVYCGFMIRYRLHNKTECNPRFFNFYLRSPSFRRALLSFSTVSANTNINQNSLKRLEIHFPEIGEQNRIVEVLNSVDKKIESNESCLKKLLKIKTGLMQDLLTGKVRVTS